MPGKTAESGADGRPSSRKICRICDKMIRFIRRRGGFSDTDSGVARLQGKKRSR